MRPGLVRKALAGDELGVVDTSGDDYPTSMLLQMVLGIAANDAAANSDPTGAVQFVIDERRGILTKDDAVWSGVVFVVRMRRARPPLRLLSQWVCPAKIIAIRLDLMSKTNRIGTSLVVFQALQNARAHTHTHTHTHT